MSSEPQPPVNSIASLITVRMMEFVDMQTSYETDWVIEGGLRVYVEYGGMSMLNYLFSIAEEAGVGDDMTAVVVGIKKFFEEGGTKP